MKLKIDKINAEVDISEEVSDRLEEFDIDSGYTQRAFGDFEIKLEEFTKKNGLWSDIPEEKEKEWMDLLKRKDNFTKKAKKELVIAIVKDLFEQQ